MSTDAERTIPSGVTRVEIDVAAFLRNVDAVRGMLPAGSRLIAMLGANAYGHGAVALARACTRHHVAMVAVSRLDEALALHQAAVDTPILVLGPMTAEEIELAAEYEIVIGVTGPEMLEEVAAVAKRGRRPVRIHLELDSGTGRLGLVETELAAAAELLAHAPFVQLDAFYSGYSTSGDVSSAHASFQTARFRDMVERLRAVGVTAPLEHMADSAATARSMVDPGSFARVGLLLFGGEPLAQGSCALEPVMRWSTRILRLKSLPPGSPVGDGAAFLTTRESRIATIPVGHADGYPFRLSGNADVLVRGRRAPVVGRISMNLASIDVTDVEDASFHDEVVLLGRQGDETITADELARQAGTVAHEIFCGAGRRTPRAYTGIRDRI